MTPFAFIIASLAIWRLSYGMVNEDGPLMIWMRLRSRLARTQRHRGGLFDMISCVRCISFWIGLGTALFVSGSFLGVFGYAFAFSACAALIDKFYSLPVVTRPTGNDQIGVGRGPAPEKRDNMVSYPLTTYGYSAVKATTTLDN